MVENNWNQGTLKRLKAMADRGLSTSEIGKKLGMTKNAIVGKLNRMGWNSKSISTGFRKIAPARKATPVKKPAPATKKPISKTPIKKIAPRAAPYVKTRGASKKSLAAHQRIIQHSLDLANLRPDQCRWPIGDPDSEKFHFCGKQAFVGKPYCYEHCLMAYQFSQPKKKI